MTKERRETRFTKKREGSGQGMIGGVLCLCMFTFVYIYTKKNGLLRTKIQTKTSHYDRILGHTFSMSWFFTR